MKEEAPYADEPGAAREGEAGPPFELPVEPPAEAPPVPEGMGEAGEGSEPPLELDMKEAFPSGGPVSEPLDEARIRKIVEEKVEKVVWEVVPELAEIMIREAIEKIKGGT